ncbi:MAG: tetratricopeptide repeat protein [bacterium]
MMAAGFGTCPQCGKELTGPHERCPACGVTLPQTDFTKLADPTLPGGPTGLEEQALELGRVLGGRYEILEVVGKGGMGWVYKARDREIDRLVALKVIRQDLARDGSVIKRFRDEIILARRVTHKNVLRIYDIAEVEGIKVISMPYIEGKDLKALILERGALGVDEAVEIARQIAEALKCAHEAGVIHRDLKPQNIMIDADGNACVADFGIAKSVEASGLTVTGQIVGTPDYMSPEQAEGKEVDYRSDIYSFGLVLYEMLTGQVAFKADSIISTLMKRLREEAAPPSRVNPAVPPWLDRLVAKALARDLGSRYASADEILSDIRSQTVRLRRRLGRKSLAAILVAGGLAVAVVAALILKPTLVLKEARTYLAILPFENLAEESGLDWLASGIPDNLTADLAQSKYFRIMSPERLRQVVGELGGDLTDVGSPEMISRLARATDLDAVVMGGFLAAGDEIRITIKVETARDQEIVGTRTVSGAEGDLLAMIDELTRLTKQIFKLSQKAIDADLDREFAAQRTKSVKAAAEFARGMESAYAGSYLEAVQAFEAAAEADPDFAMAYGKAAEAYRHLGYDDKAERLSFTAVEKVVKFMDRVPPADRTFIMAGHADITHNVDEAVRSYKDFVANSPHDPEGYYKLGLIYDSVSDWALAAENFGKAVELDPKFGSARFGLARMLINQGALDEALGQLQETLALYRDMGNREGEAQILNAIGVVYNRENKFEQAIDHYQASIKIKEELKDKRGIAASLGNLGLVYEILGRRDDALAVLTRSLEIKREIGDKLGTSTALNKIGQILRSDGRFEEALANFERSYEIRKEAGSKDLMASSLSDMGTAYSMMGRYDESLRMDSLALELRTEIGDAGDQVRSLVNLAEAMVCRGAAGGARARLGQAVSLVAGIDDARLKAKVDQTAGFLQVMLGRADSALVFLGRAYEVQQALDEKPAVAATLIWMGEAMRLKGDYGGALRSFDGAAGLAAETRDREAAAYALLGRADAFYDIGYPAGAESVLAAASAYDRNSLSHLLRCRLGVVESRKMCSSGRGTDAVRACEEICASIGSNDVRCRALGTLLCAEAELSAGEVDGAADRFRVLVEDARRYRLCDIEAQSALGLGKALLRQGRAQEAAAQSDRALGLAAQGGLCQVDYLLACGETWLNAGGSEKAAGYWERALTEAASVVGERLPRRLKPYYVAERNLGDCLDRLGELPGASSREASLAGWRATFGLK